ncbi:Hypothetical predicted protein [Paramuricea clavata]|uniref:Uncharacterized protein n=1 Tax=Paramuricea clavata TaxID=317549 RepID=A0A7D9EH37_PARCT|nr:Hypothetical predicted protein [Paramuricea clavata]
MLITGGCGRLSPGIGDISCVKDLQTEEIVTTKFRCSQFSSHHSKSDGFGWDMLNNCLNSPCSFGFAFHKKYPVQIDFSGAFSYSASGNTTSGITHESTSFVGCENHKCCGCFGPVGGKKNYCGTECRAKNGGTFVKNVYTWFWVRSSLPKRVWNKCMEYKVTVAQGKVVWYKLYNGNSIPVKGRCDQNEALLNDGIVVVPDGAAAQKVPPVPGLLEYRKDTKKLYVRSNGTWNVIVEEKKVTIKHKTDFDQLKKSLSELKSQLGNVEKILNADGKSCADLYKSGVRKDGVYTINPDGQVGSFQVRCDMQTDGGGWTVFQRRQDASVDFYRGWQDYKNGFGDLNGNFWLGLDRIHRLTKLGQNVLRVDLMDWSNETAYAKYGSFSVASAESDRYRLNLGSFSGNAGDSLAYQNRMKFSTYDRDNDQDSTNCAAYNQGAWWYKSCQHSNLNGRYLKAGEKSAKGTRWWHWKKDERSMKKTEMKIRPTGF